MWIAVAAVAAVALLIVGYAWGASRIGALSIGAGGSYDTGFAAGMSAARKKLEDSHIIPPSPATVTSISGTVKSVDTDRFVIAAFPVSMNPLDAPGPAERTSVVNGQTQITEHVPMTPDEQTAAMKLFQDNMRAGKPGTPPMPFTEKTATVNDLKISMTVTVTAASDIKTAGTVNATRIVFDALPSATPAAPVAPPSVPTTVVPPVAPVVGKPVVPPPVVP